MATDATTKSGKAQENPASGNPSQNLKNGPDALSPEALEITKKMYASAIVAKQQILNALHKDYDKATKPTHEDNTDFIKAYQEVEVALDKGHAAGYIDTLGKLLKENGVNPDAVKYSAKELGSVDTDKKILLGYAKPDLTNNIASDPSVDQKHQMPVLIDALFELAVLYPSETPSQPKKSTTVKR